MFSDHSKGFGGKFGVQKDRQDKTAMGWDYEGKTEKHESQTGRMYLTDDEYFLTPMSCLAGLE